MKKVAILAACIAASVTTSSVDAKKKPEMSGLELQQLQSREIEANKEQVFGAVMSVLQDNGYRIQAADKDTGLITAIASTSSKMTYNLFTGFGKSKKSPIVSAFIEPRTSAITRVRLSFVMGKVKSTLYGAGAQDEEPIYDPAVYQKAFEQINQTVFVRQSMDAPAATAASVKAPVVSGAGTLTPASSSRDGAPPPK